MRRMLAVGLLWMVGAVVAAEDMAWVTVEAVPVPVEAVLEGEVEAVSQATVTAQTGGEVQEILFDVDDYVEKGAVLLRMKDREQRARVGQAEARLAEAEARLAEARAEYKRVRRIFERKLVARSAMDRAEAALKAAEARAEQARAALAEAREQLEHTVVRAPYSGWVTERHIDVGEIAAPGKPLLTGVSLERLRVVTHVPQRHLAAVRRERKARVLLDEGRALDAVRVTVYPRADARSHSFKVRAYLPEGTPGLFPGMLVKVAFPLERVEQPVVPARAVLRRSEVTAVYVQAADGRPQLRQIRAGRRLDDGRQVVLAGLKASERVATDPVAAARAYKAGSAE
ncbi:efflux RND transporter periplasmic adaptor subunit [Thiohalobacter sp.]|uniref:efflux RND transporter periplasmic adaptor subunit n=1 Tax=Thiohalobacter sp. TaxID=2025948 RepID=UPI002631272B|nr:efflux RND transporter periplasmic adaptor subunit [Thiohalobacter sp.]